MKKLKIILLLLIPISGFGQSNDKAIAAPAPAASMSYSKDVEMNTAAFTAPMVNQPQVGTFQKRGIQKLQDFYNYLTIVSNPKIDKTLRENAKTQAKQLFYGVDCKVNTIIASAFIDSCFNLNKGVEWKAVDVVISENMAASTDANDSVIYRGEITFKESVDATISRAKNAQIILSKSEKQFGNTKREVWEVYICSIE